ncbi:MAG: carbohydrate kinase family protein [Candidatus Hodarchaeales archaeon]|jgi:sugar/nucleoside kinase (ribokinase family)
MRNRRIFCLGHISIDVFIQRKDLDALKIGGCISSTNLSTQGGGVAANVSHWLGALGTEVSMIGVIAEDPAGYFLQKDLERVDVRCYLKTSTKNPSASILIVVEDGGERSFIINGECLDELVMEDVPLEEIQGGNLFYTSAYNIENLPIKDTIFEILKLSKAKDKSSFEVIFNLAAYTTVENYKTTLKQDVLPFVDILIGNLEEYRALVNKGKEQSSSETLLEFVSDEFTNIQILLLTDGEMGCYYYSKEERGHTAAKKVSVIDTTGAGDGFCAGFIASYISGSSIKQAVKAGTELGAHICQGFGARYNSDGIKEKIKF